MNPCKLRNLHSSVRFWRRSFTVHFKNDARGLFKAHNAKVTSSERVSAFALLHEPSSLARDETTDKAYINQRAVLANRKILVDDLCAETPSDLVCVVCRS